MGRSRRVRKQLQGRQEAATDRTPEVQDPSRVFQRPPAQRHGSPTFDAEQEPPGARTPRRENAPGRESPATSASGGETMDTKDAMHAEDA